MGQSYVDWDNEVLVSVERLEVDDVEAGPDTEVKAEGRRFDRLRCTASWEPTAKDCLDEACLKRSRGSSLISSDPEDCTDGLGELNEDLVGGVSLPL